MTCNDNIKGVPDFLPIIIKYNIPIQSEQTSLTPRKNNKSSIESYVSIVQLDDFYHMFYNKSVLDIKNAKLKMVQIWTSKGWSSITSVTRHRINYKKTKIHRVSNNKNWIYAIEGTSLLLDNNESIDIKNVQHDTNLLSINFPQANYFDKLGPREIIKKEFARSNRSTVYVSCENCQRHITLDYDVWHCINKNVHVCDICFMDIIGETVKEEKIEEFIKHLNPYLDPSHTTSAINNSNRNICEKRLEKDKFGIFIFCPDTRVGMLKMQISMFIANKLDYNCKIFKSNTTDKLCIDSSYQGIKRMIRKTKNKKTNEYQYIRYLKKNFPDKYVNYELPVYKKHIIDNIMNKKLTKDNYFPYIYDKNVSIMHIYTESGDYQVGIGGLCVKS